MLLHYRFVVTIADAFPKEHKLEDMVSFVAKVDNLDLIEAGADAENLVSMMKEQHPNWTYFMKSKVKKVPWVEAVLLW